MVGNFIQAAKEKQSIHLRNLLLDGADPNERDEYNETALTWAAQLGHTPIVPGADASSRTNPRSTRRSAK